MWAVEAFRNHEKMKILGNRSSRKSQEMKGSKNPGKGNQEWKDYPGGMDQVFERIPGSLMAL